MLAPERHESEHNLELLIEVLSRQFVQRWDMYPRQLADGRYTTVHAPLTRPLLVAHLRGVETLGTYLLDPQAQARFMVLDADNAPDRRRLAAVSQALAHLSCPSYLEASRRGAHLWFFFDTPRNGEAVRQFGKGLLAHFNLTAIELYPKQGRLHGDGPGSLIRLPLGVHRKSGKRYSFYTFAGEPLAPTLSAQLVALAAPQTVPERLFAHYSEYVAAPPSQPVFESVERVGLHPSDRIKAAISCYDFVSQFVPLSASGLGLCPFHDDQVASFSVNIGENYWHCFTGCGGGSIIDFWMRWRNVDFVTAVADLSEMLLS
jgi:hypothetical protein